MKLRKILDDATQFISVALTRIFGPNDNSYPASGVQPFDGDPYNPSQSQD